MKKKSLFVVGGIIILTVFIAVIVFVLNGGKDENNVGSEFDFSGTWMVYQYAENKIDNEIMVFSDNKVADYRDGNAESYLESTYTYEDGTLKLTDISKEFVVKVISENNIYLVEPDTREWKLVKIAEEGKEVIKITSSDLIGKYKVISVAGEKKENEIVDFSEDKFVDTRNGEVYLECAYEIIGENLINVVDISKEYYVYKNNDFLILVDKADRYVWEMTIQ